MFRTKKKSGIFIFLFNIIGGHYNCIKPRGPIGKIN